jgi:DNA-binding transcriptional regulator LsrR (DeoR family)
MRGIDDRVIVRCCELFLDPDKQGSTKDMALMLTRESGTEVGREQIYPMIREARRRGYFSLLPRSDQKLSAMVADRYGHKEDTIHVCAIQGPSASGFVAASAAAFIVSLIRELARRGKHRVRLGLVGGRTIMEVAKQLASRLRHELRLPPLGIHVACSGFDVGTPETAPLTFLGYFADVPTNIEYVGLFASPLVRWNQYEREKERPGISTSFRRAHEIDIVLTSLSSSKDKHGPLQDIMLAGKTAPNDLKGAGYIGDVAYQPFSERAAIEIRSGYRAVTLFGLKDLVALARTPDKHVVLVGGPCPRCGRSRADAFRPLLREPSLKVWSHVFMDAPTADMLVSDGEGVAVS